MNNIDKHRTVNIRYNVLICLFLVIATLAAYWQVRNHNFLSFDDHAYVLHNQHVNKGLSLESISWAFSFTDIAYWHPLSWLSHMLDCQLYGLNPSMHHITGLIIHIINCLLLFLLFKGMTGAVWKSAFIAALFALHPINVESVAWVAERKNVLSTLFWMLTLLTYYYYSLQPGFYRYFLTLFCFFLGLIAKPMLVTLPFVLLLFDYWPLERLRYSSTIKAGRYKKASLLHLILEKIPFFLLAGASIYISSLSVQHHAIVVSTESVSMKLRVANALVSYVKYIGKMIWPKDLAVFYPFPDTLPVWQISGAALFLICVSVLVFRALKSKPYLAVGWFWYIGTLVPAIGLIQAGLWPSIADRFAYVPLIGLFIVIAWGIPDLVAQWRCKKIALAATAILVLLIFTAASRSQNRYWANNIALFKHSLDVTNDNEVAHQKLGEALAAHDKTDEAVMHYYEALRIKPDLVAAHLNLGLALRKKGKINEAVEHFSMALLAKSDCAEAYYELGVTLEKQGNFDAAVRNYSEALRIKPEFARGHNNLGIVLARQKKDKEAIFHLCEAIRIDPDYADAYGNLGIIYANQKNIGKAILHYKKALHFNPNMTQALYNLSWILASCEDEKFRNGEEAVKLAGKLCKITRYNQPSALNIFAAAYAETGKFDKAVTTAKKALDLALKQGPNELVLELKKRLRLYQEKRSYRQTQPEEGNG
ncbi:MAG: tetratricopeptide repeat protein [Deltaproteobacteria bacterium]|nr:tetratricopeptide repeat protein [Deltaproteobacteria bacterium]